MKLPPTEYIGDTKVRDLLSRYDCPLPFHAVRTRFLGSIATPRDGVSPIDTVKNLWPDKLPEFDDMAAVNELFRNLTSLWNHLARHQSRSKPFRLSHVGSTHHDLERLSQTRIEEIEGFVEGIFGDEEEVNLPERAVEGMEQISQINAMLHGVVDLVVRKPTSASPDDDLAATYENVKELTPIAEHEIHAVVLSCMQARTESASPTSQSQSPIH
jgi:hypothetical protein